MDSMVNSETFQEGILLIPEKAFQKTGEFICPNSFNGAGITLIPKPDKGVLRKASGLWHSFPSLELHAHIFLTIERH